MPFSLLRKAMAATAAVADRVRFLTPAMPSAARLSPAAPRRVLLQSSMLSNNPGRMDKLKGELAQQGPGCRPLPRCCIRSSSKEVAEAIPADSELEHHAFPMEVPVVDLGVIYQLANLQHQLERLPPNGETAMAMRRNSAELQRKKKELLNTIRSALEEDGFFQVVNHKFELDLIYNMETVARAFFDKPIEEKTKAHIPPGPPLGYVQQVDRQNGAAQIWQESFTVQSTPAMVDAIAPLIGRGPEDASWTAFLMKRYILASEAMAAALLELIAESLYIPSSTFTQDIIPAGAASLLRWNYYRKSPQPEQTISSRPHTDPVLLSLVHQDLIGGLQILKNGKWQGIKPLPDAFLIAVGDILQAVTDGQIASPKHRVVSNCKQARLSLAFLHRHGSEALDQSCAGFPTW